MEILTPQQIVSHIAGELRAYYTKHYANGLSYKTDGDSDAFDVATPTVFEYLCPPDAISDGFPEIMPSVTLIVNEITPTASGLDIDISLHTAVVNPSTSESETATPVTGESNRYEIAPGTEYTNADAQRTLYRESFDLTYRTLCAIRGMKYQGVTIDNLRMTPPSPHLENFPYSTGIVSFKVSIVQSMAIRDTLRTQINSLL